VFSSYVVCEVLRVCSEDLAKWFYATRRNIIISIGAFIIGIGMAIFLWNLIWSSAKGKPADMDDPFGLGGKYYFPYQAKNPSH
jgi:heme/copper-type cytochrome/quinol oxidase subunit 1